MVYLPTFGGLCGKIEGKYIIYVDGMGKKTHPKQPTMEK